MAQGKNIPADEVKKTLEEKFPEPYLAEPIAEFVESRDMSKKYPANFQDEYFKLIRRTLPETEREGLFFKLLNKKLDEARQMLDERFDWQCSQPAKSAKFMYENDTMLRIYSRGTASGSALKHRHHGYPDSSGLAEALVILCRIRPVHGGPECPSPKR